MAVSDKRASGAEPARPPAGPPSPLVRPIIAGLSCQEARARLTDIDIARTGASQPVRLCRSHFSQALAYGVAASCRPAGAAQPLLPAETPVSSICAPAKRVKHRDDGEFISSGRRRRDNIRPLAAPARPVRFLPTRMFPSVWWRAPPLASKSARSPHNDAAAAAGGAQF
jgi:hypothetical protein